MIAGLLPKKIEVENSVAEMTDEELQAIIRQELKAGDLADNDAEPFEPAAVH